MKFPKPYFVVLCHHFKADPASAHLCQKGFLGGAPSAPETSAVRMSEALVLALGLASDRANILRHETSHDGHAPLLGRYGYRTDLCPHGLARGAADLAYFLQEHWGEPLKFERLTEPPGRIVDTNGVIAFVDVDGVKAQGHIDIWEQTKCLGEAHWSARKILFWKLE